VLVGEPGDEAIGTLTAFAAEQQLRGAQLSAIGAFERAVVGWFDRQTKQYRRIEVDEQCEVLSLAGDIAWAQEKPQVHAHAVLGLSDGTVRGGHLLSGRVWPTLEIVVRDTPAELRKTSRPELGLALIDIPASAHTGGRSA
jgi:predicted DNA-binding protein with PD1-like motif